MTDLNSVSELNDELASAITNLAPYHSDMETYVNYYENSAFYARKPGEAQTAAIQDNYLKIFADKNIEYLAEMPEFKVAGTPQDRENANIREKILYAVHRASGTPLLALDWAHDITKKSAAVSEVVFDLDKRCARVKRYDPRYCFWKMSNGNEKRVTAFWAVFPITATEAQDTYGVTPTKNVLSMNNLIKSDPYFGNLDGQTWYIMAIRWDDKYRTAWVGDKLIEELHEHNMGVIPVDIAAPFITDKRGRLGDFYLRPMIQLQAELHDTVRRRSNIVKRMSNPIIWGRNIKPRTYDDVKAALKNAETGVLGLGKDGDVGILQLQEIKMLYEHEGALKADMQRLSGFAAASFGESVGANTSGDALGMYFTPTSKHIAKQQIVMQAFYESINAKILRAYDIFGRTGEKFSLNGYSPRSTLLASNEPGQRVYENSGDFSMEFSNEQINGNYLSRAIMPTTVPKNELAEKQFWAKAGQDGVISRTTTYEKLGLESPEDEKNLLMAEKSEPLLNPDGINTILQGQRQFVQNEAAAAAPAGLPPAPNLAAGVTNGV